MVGCTERPRIATPVPDPELFASAAVATVQRHEPVAAVPHVQWQSPTTDRVPMQLTASDGAGLRLVAVTGAVVVEDPMALTELRLVFDNPQPRRREGRFELELPPGATLSRLAMRVGDRWMEGEVVERSRAQRTYESYIHERPKVDPLLAERSAGDRISARVFPIEPMQRKEIIVSYSQALADGPFRLPLAGLPALDVLHVRVISRTDVARGDASLASVASQRVTEVIEHGRAPDEDLVVTLDGAPPAAAAAAGELVVARVRPRVRPSADPVDAVTILFDTSASAGADWDRQLSRLREVAAALGDVPLRVVAFDQTREQIFDGPAHAFGAEAIATLRERHAFGASDLVAALRDPAVVGAGAGRLVVWGDGIVTAGATGHATVQRAAEELAEQGVRRIDAVIGAGSADRELLAAITSAGLRTGIVVGADVTGVAIAERLDAAGYDDVEVRVEGAKWSWPRTLEGHVPGEDLVVSAIFEGEVPTAITVSMSDPEIPTQVIVPAPASEPLVARAVAQARIADLQAKLQRTAPDAVLERAQLQGGIIEISKRHRVLTDATAMLVLENEREYRRFGIERTALADIVTIGPGGIEPLPRGIGPTGLPSPTLPLVAAESGHFLASPYGGALGVDEIAGAGGLGLSGVGRGGGGTGEGTIGLGDLGEIGHGGSGTGRGYGRGFGGGTHGTVGPSGLGHGGLDSVPSAVDLGSGLAAASSPSTGSSSSFGGRGARVPQVRQAKARVTGSLDKDVVRRIVRAHLAEVRACYHDERSRDPAIEGRIELDFVIGPTGTVPVAKLHDHDAPLRGVGECVVTRAKRWKFPKPMGAGNVSVRYPFVFDSGAVTAAPRVVQRRRWRPAKRRRARGAAHEGRYAEVLARLDQGHGESALDLAWSWAAAEPDDMLGLVALADTLAQRGRVSLAARVLGSVIDLHPSRADLRRATGQRLAALGEHGRALAIDSYAKAVALRPDQPSGHRLLAYALAEAGRWAEAFDAIEQGRHRRYPDGRFAGVRGLLREDASLIAAAWLAATADTDADAHAAAETRLHLARVRPATGPSLRLVAGWETDATDVDLVVAAEARRRGRRLADVRTGFGPEAWVSRGPRHASSVTATVHYYERGAMGHAFGAVQAIVHDGEGHLRFDTRPFVLQTGGGAVDLGRFEV